MIADYITRNLSYNITQKYPRTTELIKQQTDSAFSSPEKNDLDSFFRKHPFFPTKSQANIRFPIFYKTKNTGIFLSFISNITITGTNDYTQEAVAITDEGIEGDNYITQYSAVNPLQISVEGFFLSSCITTTNLINKPTELLNRANALASTIGAEKLINPVYKAVADASKSMQEMIGIVDNIVSTAEDIGQDAYNIYNTIKNNDNQIITSNNDEKIGLFLYSLLLLRLSKQTIDLNIEGVLLKNMALTRMAVNIEKDKVKRKADYQLDFMHIGYTKANNNETPRALTTQLQQEKNVGTTFIGF